MGCEDDIAALLAGGSGFNATAVAEKLCATFASAEGLDTTNSNLIGTNAGLNTLYLVLCGALVFVMHAGFAMLCAGAIRSKNTMNILLQTILDAAVSALAFYLVGYAFAYGASSKPNAFIGDYLFALSYWSAPTANSAAYAGVSGWQAWFFQWAFAATATTIPAGAVAERFNFNAYLGYSFFIAAFVYPVVVHWVWSINGWLNFLKYEKLFRAGYIDFAGSSVVHMVGGLSGLMGCVMVGPRMGRFDSNGKPVDMPGHSATLVVLGTVLLWFGWYGFNPGSQLLINSIPNAAVVGRAAVITTLGGAGGALSCLLTGFFRNKAWDLLASCNGALVGFVVITAGAHVLEPWAGFLGAFIGGWIFDGVCALFLRLKIDDPLSAAPMHGFCGAWGIFWVGCMAKKEYICQSYYGYANTDGCDPTTVQGLFYSGNGRLLAAQVIGIISIAAWVCGTMGIFFYIFKLLGKLRISPEEEQAGLDVSKHGGSAYNYEHGKSNGTVAVSL